jgi:hypothetical protein
MNENKKDILIPLSPNYIVDDLQLGDFLKLSWKGLNFELDQTKLVTTSVIVGIYIFDKLPIPTWGILASIASGGLIYSKYADTHQKLMQTKMRLRYKFRKLFGNNRLSNTSSKKSMIYPAHDLGYGHTILSGLGLTQGSLYSHIPDIMQNGIIKFSKTYYGVILDCQTRQILEDNMDNHLTNIQSFLKSMQVLYKIRVSSRIPYQNKLEKKIPLLINNAKNPLIKNLYSSAYQMSAEGSKTPQWNTKMFLIFKSNEKDIQQKVNTVIPGVTKRLASASTLGTVIRDPIQIRNIYASDFSARDITQTGMPALFDSKKSIWKDELRQLMQGNIVEYPDHIRVNRNEYVTCITCGLPTGVSGFPPSLNSMVLDQLYKSSTGEGHTVKIDLSVNPVNPDYAIKVVKQSINKIIGNTSTVQNSTVSKLVLGLDIDGLKKLLEGLKSGAVCINDINYIISIYSNSLSAMESGVSQVSAILNANSITNKIPENEILETLKSTMFLPDYDYQKSIWLPDLALRQIFPLTRNPKTSSSDTGMYMGIDVVSEEEILIDLNEIPAGHKMFIGGTRSGKTSGMCMEIIECLQAEENCIYITNKPDENTRYLDIGYYFENITQMIFIGRQDEDGKVDFNINPMQILFNPDIKFNPSNKFYKHIDFLKVFFDLLSGGNMTDPQKGYFEELLINQYINKGIDPNDIRTWTQPDQPTPLELYAAMIRDYNNESQTSLKAGTIQAIIIRLSKLTTTLRWLSTPTNISMKQFTIIDLSAVSEDSNDAMHYLLTEFLQLWFNSKSKEKTNIFIDEVASMIKNKRLQNKLSDYLQKAGSFGNRIRLGTQQFEALSAIAPDIKANISIYMVYGFDIKNNIDSVMNLTKLSQESKAFLLSTNQQGTGILSIGYPYNTEYKIRQKVSPLVEQILFGKQNAKPVPWSFVHDRLNVLAIEQKVIFSSWINGDTSEIREHRGKDWTQRPIGSGKEFVYIDPVIVDPENQNLIRIDGSHQTKEHFLSCVGIAAFFAERDYDVILSHTQDADVVVNLSGELIAFEYQTSGNNDPKRIIQKRINYENKYSKLFFVGNSSSVLELSKALGLPVYSRKNRDSIIIPRGTMLEEVCRNLTGDETKQDKENPVCITDSKPETEDL